MNRITRFLSVLLVLLVAFSSFGLCAFAAGESYLTFIDAGDFYQVSKCNKYATGEINIPETYNGKPVELVASSAFKDAEKITKVTIPSSVRSVGSTVFENCVSLGTVIFEGEECTIGTAAFRYCSMLRNVTLPSKLTTIPLEAFAGCTALSSLTIPSTVTTIGKEAFKKCSSLQSVTIPASVTSIGFNAFLNCASITSFNVHSGNTAYKAVSDCLYDFKGKTLIQYPNGKTVTGFTVPAGTKTIEDSAFGANIRLTKITLPAGLETIREYAFNNCTALSEIVIPDSVTYIGSQAFGGCSNLKKVTVPANVETYSGAFYNSGIQNVIIAEGVEIIDEKAFEKCSSLVSVSIPSSVTEIRMGAFDGCTSLETLEVPETVTEIGLNAFVNCDNLTLKVKEGSAAHDYALEKNIPFELTDAEPERTVSSIAVRTLPSKTSYEEGERISTAGLVLTVNYSDGTSSTVTSGFTLNAQYASGNGTQTVTVTYKGKTAQFDITVSPATQKTIVGMQIQKLPNKVNYYYKESLSTSGMTLLVQYSDNSTATVSSGYSVPATTFKTVGSHKITVTYQGFTDDFTVNVTYAWWQMIIRILLLGFLWY